ncbi:MAG TPA: hypothetical protein VGD67_23375, partial [Pseudonocardiaceae bacterium]
VLRADGTGDGGLFTGILARYLALAATTPVTAEGCRDAAELVLATAGAAWTNRGMAHGGPAFAADWTTAGGRPAADLSVQLSAWMVLEAAARLERIP